jgi:integral membrane protein (TIGR01906 family)
MNQTIVSVEKIAGWIITLMVPVILVIGGVRLLMTPAFLEFEYRTPNFPADRYGLTLEERLRWSKETLVYLNEWRDRAYLDGLQFEDGTPIYNDREIQHIVDVQNVLRTIMRVWGGALILTMALGIWARFGGWLGTYLHALGRGGLVTAVLIGSAVFFVLVAFGIFFVFFHQVFFPPGTWQFLYSDTLIRLFPERFWRDAFLVVGTLSGVTGLVMWYFLGRRT